MQAERFLEHPVSIFVTGRSGGGKTTTVVDLIHRVLRQQVDRVVICCPTWDTQSTFNIIRDMVKPTRDIIDFDPRDGSDPFKKFYKSLVKQRDAASAKGETALRTLLLVDDMAGERMQHERMGYLARLSVQYRHLNLSIIVISQQPKLTCNAFRQNINAAICFPPSSTNGSAWVHEELNLNLVPKRHFEYMINTAWRGGRNDREEIGSHFLFVLILKRKPARYFIDYSRELTCELEDD